MSSDREHYRNPCGGRGKTSGAAVCGGKKFCTLLRRHAAARREDDFAHAALAIRAGRAILTSVVRATLPPGSPQVPAPPVGTFFVARASGRCSLPHGRTSSAVDARRQMAGSALGRLLPGRARARFTTPIVAIRGAAASSSSSARRFVHTAGQASSGTRVRSRDGRRPSPRDDGRRLRCGPAQLGVSVYMLAQRHVQATFSAGFTDLVQLARLARPILPARAECAVTADGPLRENLEPTQVACVP